MLIAGSTAAEYTVQIGALSAPNDGYGLKAIGTGQVMTRESDTGLTLYQVGTFDTRDAALPTRERLRALGYADAYIKRIRAKRTVAPRRVDDLTDEQRAKLVYVDGVPHLKEQDNFTPLDQAPSAQSPRE